MTKVAANAAVFGLVLVLLIAGGAMAVVQAVFGSDSHPSQAALGDIPDDYLNLYRTAAPLCPGLDWTILAAIGKIETDHGRSPLTGVHNGENFAGAGGPMQFLQPTFDSVISRHRIPPAGSTPPSRYNPHDAIHAATYYLCDNGARDGRDLRGAIFAYNRARWYVIHVLEQAEKYRSAVPAATPGTTRSDWPSERATEPDPTSNGSVTPRTLALVHALESAGMTGRGLGCHAHRPANPSSDHPQGRACDIMFNPHDPSDVAAGWQVTNWLITRQATLGIKYLIWQGKQWSATKPTWVAYRSTAYGCPNPANLTGCHYDHIHVSMY